MNDRDGWILEMIGLMRPFFEKIGLTIPTVTVSLAELTVRGKIDVDANEVFLICLDEGECYGGSVAHTLCYFLAQAAVGVDYAGGKFNGMETEIA